MFRRSVLSASNRFAHSARSSPALRGSNFVVVRATPLPPCVHRFSTAAPQSALNGQGSAPPPTTPLATVATGSAAIEHHTSWLDPMDMTQAMNAADESDSEEALALAKDEFLQAAQQIDEDADVQSVLGKLGVKEASDLSFVTEQDLVAAGLSAVASRKLLAMGTSAQAIVPKPAGPTHPVFSAEETMKLLAKKGINTVQRPDIQIVTASYLGGALLGWGCALTTVVAGGSSAFLAEAPGLLALLSGCMFPVGLSMIVLCGGELLTGNFMTMALPAFTHPGVSKAKVAANLGRIWGLSGFGNLLGCTSIAAATYCLSVVTPGSTAAAWLTAMTVKKCALPPLVIVGKAAGANWLVNVAIFQAAPAHTSASKIASLYLPIMTFVALGLEHSVANMFLLPLGKWLGADVTYLDIISNILPGAVGNALGAIVFVAGLQRFALLRNLVYAKPLGK